uniref:Uncharacterized protein n=1 Tax=Romanomermis culicivorax TaxID=13658 RepID=A0A915JQ91_ROMCU
MWHGPSCVTVNAHFGSQYFNQIIEKIPRNCAICKKLCGALHFDLPRSCGRAQASQGARSLFEKYILRTLHFTFIL